MFEGKTIHVHVPAGAIPKDGPSAGVTMVTALASYATRRPVRSDVAMTGEITLRGKVLPVGGIKEKVLAAHRVGIRTLILPRHNERDLEDVPAEVRAALRFVFVDDAGEVVRQALTPGEAGGGAPAWGRGGERRCLVRGPRGPIGRGDRRDRAGRGRRSWTPRRAAGSPERRLLGVRAQRAGTVDRSRRRAVGGDDLLGRDPVLHPALERAERVQGVGAGASATVMHARRQEQAEELVEAIPVLRLVGGLLEVGDGPERGERGVGPAV